MRILEMLIQELGSRSEAANALEISKSTLSGWLNERNRHPSNSSAKRVLDLAWKVNPKTTRKILDDESNTFNKVIESFVRGGANRQASES